MKRQLESRAFSVAELFAPPFLFVSPAFQRPFAWDTDDAERLLADIQAASIDAPDAVYFLGAVLLVRVPKRDDVGDKDAPSNFAGPERIFEIIDGQQRIVTLAILLAVLRDLSGSHLSEIYDRLQRSFAASGTRAARVQLRGVDGTFLAHAISEPGACLVPTLSRPDTDPQLRLLDIRNAFIRQLQLLSRTELAALANFVLDRCALVGVVTNAIDRAFQMFTVLNDTGKPLTRNDILKAELIGQTPIADRARVTELWDDLAQRLGVDFEQLFSFLRSLGGRGSNQIIEAIRAQVAATPGGSAAFIMETLAPAGRLVDIMLRAGHTGTPQSAEINRFLRYLGWLQGKEWVPPLLAFWQRHGSDPVALLAFVKALDRFAFGVRLLGLGGEKRGKRMAVVTAMITAGAPARGPWPPLQLSRDEQRTIAFSLRDLHRRSPQVCRLVLLRLNEQLGGAPMAAEPIQTVEHILPLKAPVGSQWRIDFPDADARQALATCLGNLTLVSQPINEKAGNQDFHRKCSIYFAPEAAPVSQLTAELRSVSTWTRREIEQRLARLTLILNDMWQFDLEAPAVEQPASPARR